VSGEPRPEAAEAEEGVTRIRDKRRIDPVTGQVRVPPAESEAPQPPAAGTTPSGATPRDTAPSPAEVALAERTADLQRLKAEYDNYRRRVERDRVAVAEQALASVLLGLLPVLDDIGRARAHGEVEGGFKLVADGLETTLTKLGLTPFGEPGDQFDPALHDALMHEYSAEVDRPTCVQILAPGYRLGERVLRPARVAVAEPPVTTGADSAEDEEPAPGQEV
jgi:molecular chaperone GrpE